MRPNVIISTLEYLIKLFLANIQNGKIKINTFHYVHITFQPNTKINVYAFPIARLNPMHYLFFGGSVYVFSTRNDENESIKQL